MESNTIKFIGRIKEIQAILDFIENKDRSGNVIIISGEGGIGKTRLLEEVRNKVSTDKRFQKYTLNKVIDFDNQRFHSADRVANYMIDRLKEHDDFQPYFKQLEDFRKIESANVSKEKIKLEREAVINAFVDNYNSSTTGEKHIWFFDTIEKLRGPEGQLNKDIIKDWIKKFPRLKNSIFIFAGRPKGAEELDKKFHKKAKITPAMISLKGFSPEESQIYIAEKQQLLEVSIDQEWSDKLIALSEGKPIFLDLAIEWFVQEVEMSWLDSLNITAISSRTKEDFEEKIISKIRELRYSVDWVIFVLAHIFPLDKEGFDILFRDEEDVDYTFEQIQQMVFVKSLPTEEIKLHDEMQRIVTEHIVEEIDGDLIRRQYYSRKIIGHLRQKVAKQETAYEAKLALSKTKGGKDIDLKLEIDERKVLLNELTNQLIIHTFFADPERGKQELSERIEELTSGRWTKLEVDALLRGLNSFLKSNILSDDIDFLLDRARLQIFAEKSQELEQFKSTASEDQRVEISLLESSDLVRKGRISESIAILQQAEELNTKVGNKLHKIRLDIDLGYNLRLIGDLKSAKERYEKAIQTIIEEKGLDDWEDHPDLAIRYGWTQNNLAFVLSDANEDRRKAVNQARTAIYHWSKIDHPIGLGAGHSVLGITFYRIDKSEQALEEFGKALEIFEDLALNKWISQIYSWRGAAYQDRNEPGDLKRAEEDLNEALKLARDNFQQIVPMTLNRLGRVHMSTGDWGKAEDNILESLEQAKLIPDYVYWLGSIGRLGYVIAEYDDAEVDLDFMWQEYEDFLVAAEKENVDPEKNSLGITQLALARLELRELCNEYSEERFERLINLLQQGIPAITEHGSYARTDIESRLTHFENEFSADNAGLIRKIGDRLYGFIVEQTKTENGSSYYIVLEKIGEWKTWKN